MTHFSELLWPIPDAQERCLQEHLTGEMVAFIDFGHLPELREGSFVDEGCKDPMRCLVPGSPERRQDTRIFLLLEHKSHVAPGTRPCNWHGTC